MYKLNVVKIVGGPLHQYLKDIEIVGREEKGKEKFYIFGCKTEDEKQFYEGILNADKAEEKSELGFKTVEEVEEFWLNGCNGMVLTVEKRDYEVIN